VSSNRAGGPRHTPTPSTHIYRYKGSMYNFHWDPTGMAMIPVEVEYLWVDYRGNVQPIKKRKHNALSYSRFLYNMSQIVANK
jgi:hypothetical protein